MQLEVKIDQAESIRRGINAPHSIIKLEVDVSTLDPKYREYIATYLREGHKLHSDISNGDYPKALAEPTLRGFTEMLDARLCRRGQRPTGSARQR